MARAVDTSKTNGGAAPAPLSKAQAAAEPGDWLSLVLEHHAQIRTAFVRALEAPPDGGRLAAMKGLAVLLTGHSIAEEVVLYPVLAQAKSKGAGNLYDQQSAAKVEMAALERLDPASEDWADKVAEIQAAVLEHMQEEEDRWFIDIKASDENQAKLTARYKEEFERYTRTGAISTNGAWAGPPRPDIS